MAQIHVKESCALCWRAILVTVAKYQAGEEGRANALDREPKNTFTKIDGLRQQGVLGESIARFGIFPLALASHVFYITRAIYENLLQVYV